MSCSKGAISGSVFCQDAASRQELWNSSQGNASSLLPGAPEAIEEGEAVGMGGVREPSLFLLCLSPAVVLPLLRLGG